MRELRQLVRKEDGVHEGFLAFVGRLLWILWMYWKGLMRKVGQFARKEGRVDKEFRRLQGDRWRSWGCIGKAW